MRQTTEFIGKLQKKVDVSYCQKSRHQVCCKSYKQEYREPNRNAPASCEEKHLQGTKYFALFQKDEKSYLIGFTDNDYAVDQDERKSNPGYVYLLRITIVSLSCRKEKIVNLSSTEVDS